MIIRNEKLAEYLQPGNHVHLVGIGGARMRPLALDRQGRGIPVTGTATNSSGATQELLRPGTEIILTGEICEWALGEHVRDAAQMGYRKAILVLGQTGSFTITSEVVVAETVIVGDVPNTFLQTGGNYEPQREN